MKKANLLKKSRIPLGIAILCSLQYANQGISSLSQQSLYYLTREFWGLSATMLGLISWVTGLAWYCKIFFGYLIDNVTIKGKRTTYYLRGSYILMLLAYAYVIIFGFNLLSLIIIGILINACIALADVSVDREMVITERKYNLKGRLQALQWSSLGIAGLVVAVGGAWIAKTFPEHVNYKIAEGISALFVFGMLIYLFKCFKEKKEIVLQKSKFNLKKLFKIIGIFVAYLISISFFIYLFFLGSKQVHNFEGYLKCVIIASCMLLVLFFIIAFTIILINKYKQKFLKHKLIKKIKNKKFLIGLAFIACLGFCPSFGTALMIKARETLHVDKMFLGYLGAMGTVLGVIGYFLYYKWAYKFPMKKLLYFMIVFTAITNLFYLYIPNKWFLLSYNLIFGAFGGITFMTLLAFFVHIIPSGSEALMYAIVTSTNNFFVRGGNFFGGVIYDKFGYNITVLISSGLTLLCIFFIPKLLIKEDYS